MSRRNDRHRDRLAWRFGVSGLTCVVSAVVAAAAGCGGSSPSKAAPAAAHASAAGRTAPRVPAGPPPMQVGRFVGAIGVGLRHDTVTIGVGFRVVGQGTPDLALAARVLRGVARHARYNFASSGPLLLSVQDQAKARVPGLLETAYLEIADPRFRLDELTVLWVSRGDAVTLDPVLCPSRSVAWVAVSRSAAVCGPAITIVPTPAGAAAAPRS